ncbi:hypothetical protein LCGC14_0374700 [marine sediment metagenome]|uniref:Uncharacterized protein n=1 Tax=marine sediment metagenome TaxID=412755 RepID=A0A0F9T493_9ZZZZ
MGNKELLKLDWEFNKGVVFMSFSLLFLVVFGVMSNVDKIKESSLSKFLIVILILILMMLIIWGMYKMESIYKEIEDTITEEEKPRKNK